MTTELVLLLAIFVFVFMGAFLGEKGPIGVLRTSGSKLGARVEQNISTGHGFVDGTQGAVTAWLPADSNPTNDWKK